MPEKYWKLRGNGEPDNRHESNYPVSVEYGNLSTRIKVEVMLGERVMATEKWSEDGVVRTVWVPKARYEAAQKKVDEIKIGYLTWFYSGWNLKVAELYWDVGTRPATALNLWDQLGLV